MDQFFEEIKARQEGIAFPASNDPFNPSSALSEDEINFYGLDKGSFDNGDPNTTNLYLGNLSPFTTG
jgi:hypothetical protein